MEPFKKIVVLENDEQRHGLPDSMQSILDANKDTPSEVWWWFGEDVRQNTQQSFAKFKELAPDSLFVTNPSFAGVGNSFDGKLFLFKMLMEQGIKIRLHIAYYPDFYWFLISWMGESRKKTERQELLATLKACLDFHGISYASSIEVRFADQPLSLFTRLTWDSLMENYFEKGDKVRIKVVHQFES